MRKTTIALLVLAALVLSACGSGASDSATVTATKTVVVDTSARVADFKEQDYRGAMIEWFEEEMCGDDTAFACRCFTDRLNWQHDTADGYRDFVVDLIREKKSAIERADDVRERCRALTSSEVMTTLSSDNASAARETAFQLKKTTAQLLGERVPGDDDNLTCTEWDRVPRSVRRVFAREVMRNVAWEALHSRESAADVLAAIDVGCEAHPDDSATGWVASEMMLASGGESELP